MGDELFCRMCGIKRGGMQADFQRASVMVAVEKEQEIRRQGLQDNNPDAGKDLMVPNKMKLMWKASHKWEKCCPRCGNAYKADEVFCRVCGTERTGTEAGLNDEALQPAVEKDTYVAGRDGKEKVGRSEPRAKVQAKVQSKGEKEKEPKLDKASKASKASKPDEKRKEEKRRDKKEKDKKDKKDKEKAGRSKPRAKVQAKVQSKGEKEKEPKLD